MPISADYDREADALYVRLTDGERHRTVEINETTYVDVDVDDHAMGLELLYPSVALELDSVSRRFALDAQLPEIVAAISAAGAPVEGQTFTSGHHLSSMVTIVTTFEGTVGAGGLTPVGSVSRVDRDSQVAECV